MEAKAAGRLSRESWSKKGVEDRHEALSIFFDMKVTVRGSGEEGTKRRRGRRPGEAGSRDRAPHTHMWEAVSIRKIDMTGHTFNALVGAT